MSGPIGEELLKQIYGRGATIGEEERVKTVRLFRKILTAVLNDPTEPKFRRVNRFCEFSKSLRI